MTGGDCYDLWALEDGRLAVLLADASGHGIGPAMVVSQVRAMVRLLCERSAKAASPIEPESILAQINRQLERDLTPGQFVTAFLAFIGSDGKVAWSSAGHGPILVKSSPHSPVQCVSGGSGIPLGILPDCFNTGAPVPPRLRLDPGGTLLVMSDGVFEAFDPDGNQFGVPRVTEMLESAHAHPEQLLSTVQHTIDAWHLGEDPVDDQTLVAVRRKAPADAESSKPHPPART
jgi:serine phosphatase RsbU (regulator of sigma subunit)